MRARTAVAHVPNLTFVLICQEMNFQPHIADLRPNQYLTFLYYFHKK